MGKVLMNPIMNSQTARTIRQYEGGGEGRGRFRPDSKKKFSRTQAEGQKKGSKRKRLGLSTRDLKFIKRGGLHYLRRDSGKSARDGS